MHVLVVNDDGIQAEGLWVLAGELSRRGKVTVVAPDRERSAIGTAVTLFEPLHAEAYASPLPGITAWMVDGTPSDCTILGLGALTTEPVDTVVSGINPGLNVGEDVHISGTVGGALQGYFRGLPVIAVSASAGSIQARNIAAEAAAEAAMLMVTASSKRMFVNINVPDCPDGRVKGVRITRLARASHINTVAEETSGDRRRYHMTRTRLPDVNGAGTDIEAVNGGYISLTALYTSLPDKPPQRLLKQLGDHLNVMFGGGS